MKFNKSIYLVLALSSVCMSSCSDSFLEPDPSNMYEPSTTFSTESGLAAALAQVDNSLKIAWCGDQSKDRISTQMQFADLVTITTGNASGYTNMYELLTPNMGGSELNDVAEHAIIGYWNKMFDGVKYANTVIQYAPYVKGLDQSILNQYVGRALFHRSLRYFALINEFRNVPLVTKVPEIPKFSFKSCSREAILEMIAEDMKKAVEYVPVQEPGKYSKEFPGGYVNNAACRILYAKILMSLFRYDEALEQLNAVEAQGYRLMMEPFGKEIQTAAPETWPIKRNVIWDLNRHENVFNSQNMETIYGLSNSGTNLSSSGRMRTYMPFFFADQVHAPNGDFDADPTAPTGKQALSNYTWNNLNSWGRDEWNKHDWLHAVGRGICSRRPTPWYQHMLWGNIQPGAGHDDGDLRHSSEYGNWLRMEDLTYNHKDTQEPDKLGRVWFGEHLTLYDPLDVNKEHPLCVDTLRRWYNVPFHKIYEVDEGKMKDGDNQYNGVSGGFANGCGDLCFYRFAEVILLRAECYIYKHQPAMAAEQLNLIRKREHCDQMYGANVTIDDVFDERARELYLEEWRHDELVRASYCMAHDPSLTDSRGMSYNIDGIEKETGTDRSGGSYWYQRCINYSLYNDGITYLTYGDSSKPELYYSMGKNNIYWPIPDFVINANNKADLYQNFGYAGYDSSKPLFTDWKEAEADQNVQ